MKVKISARTVRQQIVVERIEGSLVLGADGRAGPDRLPSPEDPGPTDRTSARGALVVLLERCCTDFELRALVATFPFPGLSPRLPAAGVPLSALALEVVLLLEREALVFDFLQHTLKQRPRSESEIRSIFTAYSTTCE